MTQALNIRELRVRAVRIPMAEPHRTASGVITESPLVLTDVVTDPDIIGHSYVFCYSALALQPTALLVKGLEPLIAGRQVAPLGTAWFRDHALSGSDPAIAAWRPRRRRQHLL